MFKCPVCHHASLSLFRYTVKTALGGAVSCPNCGTKLHQRPALRNALVVLPFILIFLPVTHFRISTSLASDVFWLFVAGSLSLALAVWLTRLEPTNPNAQSSGAKQ